jgi:GNAT superfamily N-acetyltransferase
VTTGGGKRGEDKDDDSVWTVTRFVVRAGFRGRGLTRVLVRRGRVRAGARGAGPQGLPYDHRARAGDHLGETHVGTRSIFEAAGFVEAHRATLRRVVMWIDF